MRWRFEGFSRSDVLAIRDKAHRTRSWHYANYLVTVLSVMFRWGVERGLMTHNPCAGIVRIERPKQLPDANRPWLDEERETVLAAAPSVGIKACIALGMFASRREADAVGMTWDAIGKDGWIRWKMRKTGDLVPLPIHPRLAEIPEEVKGDTSPLPTRRILTGRQSRAMAGYTMNGFRVMFFQLIRKLEREGKVRPGLTFHGLRHTIGAMLANRGASTKMKQTALGTARMAEHYSRAYDKRTLLRRLSGCFHGL